MSIKNKLWYKIEMYVAKRLRLKRISFSGGVWPNKEDNESLDIICQCKATKKKQISIKKVAIENLYKRSVIQEKIPIFVFHIDSIEFDKAKTWVAMTLEDFVENDGECLL